MTDEEYCEEYMRKESIKELAISEIKEDLKEIKDILKKMQEDIKRIEEGML